MKTVRIGNVEIEQSAALAPMASVADLSYRVLCKEFGAAYLVGEMASAKGLCYSDKKTRRLLSVTEAEYPMAVQLFGDDPVFMAKAAAIAASYHPQIIDINMGCPVPKVAGSGSGVALMKRPERAYDIVRAMVKETDIPVTVKIRKGLDEETANAPAFAKLMQDAGASAIAVHGRTKKQMYAPPVDLAVIRAVKEAVTVPVIGNGGITSGADAYTMYQETGCDLVMVGQASYGRPWIFSHIRRYLETGEELPEPSLEQRLSVMLRHVRMIVADKGESSGMREARKHAAWYIRGAKGAAAFRQKCGLLTQFCELEALACEILAMDEKVYNS